MSAAQLDPGMTRRREFNVENGGLGHGLRAAAFCKVFRLFFSEILPEQNSAFYGESFIIWLFQNQFDNTKMKG